MQLERGSDKQLGSMILRGTARMIGGRVARMAITLGGIAVLARLLTPADFGVVAVAAMILPLANALLEGLIDVPTIREDTLDRDGLSNLIWSGVLLMAGLGALLWLAAPWLAVMLSSPELTAVLRVLCFALLFQPFVAASHAVLRRQHRFGVSALFMPAAGAVYVLSAIVMALMGLGVWSLILGQIASLAVTALGLAMISNIPLRPPLRLQAGTAWRLGGLGFVTRLLAWVSSNIDTLFASAALGPASTGIYSRAYNLTTQMKEPFAVLDQAVRQAFVAQRSLDDVAASRATLDGLRLVVIAASLVAGAAIVMREAIVTLLLGSQWGYVVLPFAILAASLPARVARLYLDGFTYARGSIGHMLLRNISIVLMLLVALWVWADHGVVYIALVVASVHVVTLFFKGGETDVAVAGSIGKRLRVLFPGYAAGVSLVTIGELAAVVLSSDSEIVEWAMRAIVCLSVFLVAAFLLPGRWMPSAWNRAKGKIIRSFYKIRSNRLG